MKINTMWLPITAAALMSQSINGEATTNIDEVVHANNQFGIDLYSHLAQQPDNVVYSPLAIETALAMTYAGARGNTATQISKVLHFQKGDANIHTAFGLLLKELNQTNDFDHQFAIASCLWIQRGYPLLESFRRCLSIQYNSPVNQIDLTGWPHEFNTRVAAAAREQINDWVLNKTYGRIKEILPQHLPDSNTRLILVNAIYFRSFWATPFNKALTKESLFHIDSKRSVSVPMMHLSSSFNYNENDAFQMLELPYIDSQFSMIILLPKTRETLLQSGSVLSVSLIEELRKSSRAHEVNISMPKFKEIWECDLRETLQKMGMQDAFSGNADFSDITTAKPFFIQADIHKAYVGVDEEGTEAAASTAVVGGGSEPEIQANPVNFDADHPFLFLICDTSTDTILFIGRVVDPSRE